MRVAIAAEDEALAAGRAEGAKGVAPAEAADLKSINRSKSRDWKSIPVGLPFTEMVTRASNFTVTHLEKQKAGYRETWMQPMQARCRRARQPPCCAHRPLCPTHLQQVLFRPFARLLPAPLSSSPAVS